MINTKTSKRTGDSVKIGVVVPTYNRKDTIQQNLDALLNQDFQEDYKVVIVDDGSTDGTFEHLLAFYNNQIMVFGNELSGECRRLNPKGKLSIIKQKNRGVSAARNVGLKMLYQLGCEYFTHQDSDDVALPHKLKTLAGYLDANNYVGLVHAKAHTMTKDGFFLEPQDSPWERYYDSAWWDFNEDGEKESMWEMARTEQWKKGDLNKDNYIHNHTVMYTRNAIEALGLNNLYDENKEFGADWDFNKKLEKAGVRFGFVDDYIVISRYHTMGITGNELKRKTVEELLNKAQVEENLFGKTILYSLIQEKIGIDIKSMLIAEDKMDSLNDLWDVKFNLAFEKNLAVNNGNPVKACYYATLLSNIDPTLENKQITTEFKESLNLKYIFERDFHLRLGYLPEATQYAKKAYALAPTVENREVLTELLR